MLTHWDSCSQALPGCLSDPNKHTGWLLILPYLWQRHPNKKVQLGDNIETSLWHLGSFIERHLNCKDALVFSTAANLLSLGGIRNKGRKKQNPFAPNPFYLPAQPKARWYLEDGLNFTQHTLALASMLATELSKLVDHSFTRERERETQINKNQQKHELHLKGLKSSYFMNKILESLSC